MKISDLITATQSLKAEYFGPNLHNVADREIGEPEIDSRKTKNGSIFFATNRSFELSQTNTVKYIEQALDNSCSVIFFPVKLINSMGNLGDLKNQKRTLIVAVDNVEDVLLKCLTLLYPLKPRYLIGITGTNGKTSTVNFIQQISNLLGVKSASIGTIGVNSSHKIPTEVLNCLSEGLTTPDVITLHKVLHLLAYYNFKCVAMEASSHALHQDRMLGITFNCVGFTSFSQDHLDYHKTMDEYLDAKSLIFAKHCRKDSLAAINREINEYFFLEKKCQERYIKILDYGFNANYLKIINISQDNNTQKVQLKTQKETFEIELNVSGRYQVYNILCAMLCLEQCKTPIDQIIKVLPKVKDAPGRLERVVLENGVKANVYIDYAHTPDALQNAISSLKELGSDAKIDIVFGCGGDRDRTKRPRMGKTAQEMCNNVYVTDDNPRSEDPSIIRKEIISGMGTAATNDTANNDADRDGKGIFEIDDRESAIKTAIDRLRPENILLIAGKGHEKYQIIKGVYSHFDDYEIAKNHLESK